MHSELVLMLGWVAVPLIAYVGGRLAISRTTEARAARPPIDPMGRLEELRRQVADGQRVPRGRMAEAVRLAESSGAPSRTRQS